MTSMTRSISSGMPSPEPQSGLPQSWIVEKDGEVAAEVNLTSAGKFRVTSSNGRKLGTFDTLAQVRHRLESFQEETLRERIRKSTFLMFGGLFALIASIAIAIVGATFLLRP
ncbi:MAG: hypothetical protein KF742_00355 [Cryobacterium sp.]|nr:hypothetical protein [Cryobacterium sp.]MCO5293781.1 hypothetical protein [Homoserinimonas sp.]